ncbi:hypothetical protein QLX08_003435 [Tetragonisca angustula]|uniref:PBZ-type domain-containing protein n=1 Tax=Tetragonisca angustula TaxID=166442 RepID=A0AAW1A6W1_9HYME
MSDREEEFRAYREDVRIPCRYGAKCYQKNAVHHEKYKHPPMKGTGNGKAPRRKAMNQKRKKGDDSRASNDSPQKKIQKINDEITNSYCNLHIATCIESSALEDDDTACEITEKLENSHDADSAENSGDLVTIASLLQVGGINVRNGKILTATAREVIPYLFLLEMPEDFFHLYEFCENICKGDPLNALKDLNLQLIGPYDVFREEFINGKVENKEALLRHWRYYYDPPEFQTVIRENGKDGLHFGYWRDDASEKPVFIAKNKAGVNCVIEPVAENIFGALDVYFELRLKLVTPFEKIRVAQLHQRLKSFASSKKITIEKRTASMQAREKQTVTRTFHRAGIVVPYNKKTQLGYRDLAVTDSELQKLLKQIENAPMEVKKTLTSKLEEVIRLATIAADECDFGTVLELGHDLFCSGVPFVKSKALNLLSLAYSLLQRPQFFEILKSHLKDRRKSLDLSVVRFG